MTKCTHCNGTGIYQRYTSYTVNGVPICFECQGTGQKKVKVQKRRLDRHAKWQIVGCFSVWPKEEWTGDIEIPF